MFKQKFIGVCSLILCGLIANAQSEKKSYDLMSYELYNKVQLPIASLSNNLVQNPSFEQNELNWTNIFTGNTRTLEIEHGNEWFKIDDTQAYQGKKSARLKIKDYSDVDYLIKYDVWQRPLVDGLKAQGKQPAYYNPYIVSYYMQVENGKKYTLSLYAKTTNPGLEIQFGAAHDYAEWNRKKVVKLNKEWTRYEYTFIANKKYVCIYFGQDWTKARPTNVADGTLYWVDAIQLEKGDKATEFTMKPLVASLVDTNDVVNVDEAKDITVKIDNFSKKSYPVECDIVVKDYFKNVVFTKKFAKATINAGTSKDYKFNLGDNFNKISYNTIEINIKSGDYKDTEIYRYAVLDPKAVKNSKHRNFFGYGSPYGHFFEKQVEMYDRLGLGIMLNNCHNQMEEELVKLWKNCGAPVIYTVYGRYDYDFEIVDKDNIQEHEYQKYMDAYREHIRKHKYIKYWKLLNEPEHGWKNSFLFLNPKQHVEFMKRLYTILKEEIPDCVVVSPDLANVSVGSLDWMEAIMKEGAHKYWDIMSIHTYQKTPEVPSLDKSTQDFIALADKYGFKGKLWYTEGGHFIEQTMPSMKFDATVFDGHFDSKMPKFTNDIIGSHAGVALGLRTVLVVLKHADRITANTEWAVSPLGLDSLTMMPEAHAMAYHAMSKELGNSKFVEEYNFSDSVRAYLFDDGNGKGVAALWDYDLAVSREQRLPLILKLDNSKNNCHVVTIFDQEIPLKKDGSLLDVPVTDMPVLIKADSVAELKAALDKSYVLFNTSNLIMVETSLKDPYNVNLRLFNQFNENLKGRAVVKVNGKTFNFNYDIAPRKAQNFDINISNLVNYNNAHMELKGEVTIYNNKDVVIKKEEFFNNYYIARKIQSPIKIDGKLDDWKNFKSYELPIKDRIDFVAGETSGSDDLSAKVYTAWDKDNIYVAVAVKDDVMHQEFEGGNTWQNDCIQLFFDTYDNGTKFDANLEDDFCYNVAKTKSGDQVYKAYVPSWQNAFTQIGLSEDVEKAIVRDEANKLTIYELKFHRKTLLPLGIKDGELFGFSVMVNDSDGNKRVSALNDTNGDESWANPGCYPSVILIDKLKNNK